MGIEEIQIVTKIENISDNNLNGFVRLDANFSSIMKIDMSKNMLFLIKIIFPQSQFELIEHVKNRLII